MYKQMKNYDGTLVQIIQRLADSAFIPFSEDNTDYQAYLAWLAEGNVPIEADA